MSHYQELTAIADDISDLSPESAVRLRALAMRVRQQERYCDDAVEQSRLAERLANSVAVEHLRLVRR
jgi:hypothetical protein